MQRLLQLKHPAWGRRVALVEEDNLCLLTGEHSVYQIARKALADGKSLPELLADTRSGERLEYDPIYQGQSEWKLLPAFDHPSEPARCLVTGAGLTHKGAAEKRRLSGEQDADADEQPEWFYKGCGAILRAHGEPLVVPHFSLGGGEEAEVAGIYIIDNDGLPRRLGLALGNEFSDHKGAAKNSRWLAHSKLRPCALGPELIVDADFTDAPGSVRIDRGSETIWVKPFATGEKNMAHTVAELEHHHFKYETHRRPGDAHIHFFGADVISFADGIELEDGDVVEIRLAGFGRALRNPIEIDDKPALPVTVQPL